MTMEELLGIGQLARTSGLTVSALRFYNSAQVLTPAVVDPRTGYRAYGRDQVMAARLIARLRRAGMPLAEVREVLACRDDHDRVEALVSGHLARLTRGLLDARRELSFVRSDLEPPEHTVSPTTMTVAGSELAAVLAAVRFAVSTDPEPPALTGVLFEIAKDSLTLVATDRYRLAIASTPARLSSGPGRSVVVPASFADAVVATGSGYVELAFDAETVTAAAHALTVRGTLIDERFPDYGGVLPARDAPTRPIGADLRDALAVPTGRTMRRDQDGAPFDVTVLTTTDDGRITVTEHGDGIAVNREFLMQAIDAGGPDQLLLALDGPITPLVIRSPRSMSLLMPVRM